MIKYNHPLHKVFRIFESFSNMNKYGNRIPHALKHSSYIFRLQTVVCPLQTHDIDLP